MSYGIRENKQQTLCANCGRVISESKISSANYCFHCGNPLKIESIEKAQDKDLKIKNEFISLLKNVSKTLNTDSLEQILNQIDEEI